MHYNLAGLFSYLAQVAFGGLHPKEAKELLEDYFFIKIHEASNSSPTTYIFLECNRHRRRVQ
jgi:hypothetical protein